MRDTNGLLVQPDSQRSVRVSRAFTLVELLVVIAVIALLVTMLLPAVQSAREAARRTQCINNQRQVALAAIHHHEAIGYFPHGTYNYIDSTPDTPAPYNNRQDRRCWFHDLLPFIEEQQLFDAFQKHMNTGASALAFPLLGTPVESYMCPSDGLSPKLHTFWGGIGTETQGFSGNFVACAGNDYFNPAKDAKGKPINTLISSSKLNGIFFAQSKVRMAQIEDGTSHTAVISELILSPDTTSHDIRGRYYNPGHGGVLFSTRIPPNTLVPDRFNWCSDKPVPRAPCVWSGSNMFVSARSYHPGGVNMAMADGSVRFVEDTVDASVYAASGSRNGEEAGNL